METRFYRLSKSSTASGVARLASAVAARGQKIAVICQDENHMDVISKAMWSEVDFLPHGLGKSDGVSQVTLSIDGLNEEVVFVVDGAKIPDDLQAERLCLMFHASDIEIVNARRNDWKGLSANGAPISYWAESETGAWEKKAEENPKT